MPLFNSKIDVQRYAIIQYIQDNYRDVTLSTVAKRFHYSNEYTSRLIKDLMGMTYTEVVRYRSNRTVPGFPGKYNYDCGKYCGSNRI